jgi:hypothetical protein
MAWDGVVVGQCRQAERLAVAVQLGCTSAHPKGGLFALLVGWSFVCHWMHDNSVTNSRAVTLPCDSAWLRFQGPAVFSRIDHPRVLGL